MAGLFDKQSDLYLDARPTYPSEWYSMLASHSLRHSLAWDVGTGNGQAAIGVAEHYDQVIGTDTSSVQLSRAIPHPRVQYIHTPASLPDDELVALVGGENSVDLVTVAQAVHWFDLPKFYSVVSRVLRKPGGVIAVWCYNDLVVSPEFDAVFKKFHDTTLPFWHPDIRHVFDGYRNLPFPFEAVGGGAATPKEVEIPKEMSIEGVVKMVQSWSAVITARDRGVELLPESVVKEMEIAWGGSGLVKSIVYKAFMLVGKVNNP
ncbi:Putative methyltransferase DDB_G0268948 [Linum grandiflorum]